MATALPMIINDPTVRKVSSMQGKLWIWLIVAGIALLAAFLIVSWLKGLFKSFSKLNPLTFLNDDKTTTTKSSTSLLKYVSPIIYVATRR